MKLIFQKTNFPKSSRTDRYEWKEAETTFEISKNGRYVIAVTALCKNGKQNNTGDDDDLRISINGYEFGKSEINSEYISYNGFGTSAAFDGASLKGSQKTVYFFVDLDEELESLFWFNENRQHTIKFYADGKPEIKKIKVFQLAKNESFKLENQTPKNAINTNKKGIPWMTFVFLGTQPRSIILNAKCRSSKQKAGMDGDNIKVLVNGNILKNTKASTSDKYKNFYFSGDQNQGKNQTLILKADKFHRIENALELWYDQTPIIEGLEIEFFENKELFLEELNMWDNNLKEIFYQTLWNASAVRQKITPYTVKFLLHSLQQEPKDIIFDYEDPFVNELKKDEKAYNKILKLIKEELQKGQLKGEIITGNTPETEINFEASKDLATAIHGIKKIYFEAIKKENGNFEIDIKLVDIYDFDRKRITDLTSFMVYLADQSEKLNIIKNYEIIMKLKENLTLSK